MYVCLRKGEESLESCVVPVVKFGGCRVMVWGAMSARGAGLLYTIHGRLNGLGYINILSDYCVPSAHLLGYGEISSCKMIKRHVIEPRA